MKQLNEQIKAPRFSLYLLPQKHDSFVPVVETFFNLPKNSLYRRTREREIAQARQIAMWLECHFNYREDGSWAYRKIASKYPGEIEGQQMDHVSVIHAKKTINNLMSISTSFRHTVYQLEKIIFGDVLFTVKKLN